MKIKQLLILFLPLLLQAAPFSIGDRVWIDSSEVRFKNATIELYNASNIKIKSTTTDANEEYKFTNLAERDYRIKLIVPNEATAVTLTSIDIWLDSNRTNIDFGILNSSILPSRDAIIPIDSNLMLGGEDKILYYTDAAPSENGLNRVLRVDYGKWKFSTMGLNGVNPHSVDRAGATNKFYIRTKNSKSIDVINFKTHSIKTVSLGKLKARSSGAVNLKYNISIIASANAPASSIIEHGTDKIITVLGDPDSISDGANAMGSGHPVWINEDYLALLNTLEMVIELYHVEKVNNQLKFTLVDWVHFDVGLHTIARVREPKNSEDLMTFYGLEEADKSLGLATPRVWEIKFNAQNETLDLKRSVLLSQSTTPINGIKANLHHGGTSPDGNYLVIPTYNKKVYIINRKTMKVDKVLPAGLGAGHIEFSKQENLAIVTNHYDENVTIIDMNTLTVKANIDISTTHFNPSTKRILQPHFGHVSKDGRYYYTFATQDGDFVEIDLKTLKVTRRLHVGGAPEQSHS